jgi:hypothetical protein
MQEDNNMMIQNGGIFLDDPKPVNGLTLKDYIRKVNSIHVFSDSDRTVFTDQESIGSDCTKKIGL